MNVALILVSLGIANAPLPFGHPLVVAYFEDMASCVEAANQAKLPVAGIPGRSLNTWVQFVCVPAKPIIPWAFPHSPTAGPEIVFIHFDDQRSP